MKTAIIILAVVVLLVLVSVAPYNRLVGLQQGVDKQWAQVENVYQRRADLVPNLIATVSGAANFEKSTLVELTEARASVGKVQVNAGQVFNDPAKFEEFQRAQDGLASALSRLLVVLERYPDLKATQNFRDLQAQLEGTENRIAVERGRFNEAVQAYNTACKRYPGVLYAGMMGLRERPYFASTPGAATPPKVEFQFGGAATNR
jgi:LemA protein